MDGGPWVIHAVLHVIWQYLLQILLLYLVNLFHNQLLVRGEIEVRARGSSGADLLEFRLLEGHLAIFTTFDEFHDSFKGLRVLLLAHAQRMPHLHRLF